MKKLIFLLFPLISYAQAGNVGINTSSPTKTLDVNGELRIRTIPAGSLTDQILVVDAEGNVKKVLVSSLQQNTGTCPNFLKNQSSGYHLKFSSASSVPNPGNNLIIQGKNFISAGAHVQGNTYFFAWTNTSGQAININNLNIDFGGMICNYN